MTTPGPSNPSAPAKPVHGAEPILQEVARDRSRAPRRSQPSRGRGDARCPLSLTSRHSIGSNPYMSCRSLLLPIQLHASTATSCLHSTYCHIYAFSPFPFPHKQTLHGWLHLFTLFRSLGLSVPTQLCGFPFPLVVGRTRFLY